MDKPSVPSVPPFVIDGHVTALRLFDLAFSIDLVRAETLWASRAGQGARSRLSSTPLKAVAFGEAPLGLLLPPVTLLLGEQPVEATVSARLYAFGVVTLAIRVTTKDLAWDAYTARVNAIEIGRAHV